MMHHTPVRIVVAHDQHGLRRHSQQEDVLMATAVETQAEAHKAVVR